MKICFTVLLGFLSLFVSSQEVLSPIGAVERGEARKFKTKSINTLDSTFIYSFDTLSLPFLDEFSKNRFPKMDAQPGDLNVTEEQYFYILDQTDLPFLASQYFSTTPTKKFTTTGGVTTESNLPLVSIKIADFQNYPIVYSLIQVYPPYNVYDSLDFVNQPDTIQLSNPDVSQDSIRIFRAHETGTDVFWTDLHTYHNYTFAVKPWTLGVATFDGVDASGYPYAFGTTQVGYADYLTSKVIDMSSFGPADSIYMSFLYQFEGFSDPAESNDSIILEFYNQGNDSWDWIWSKAGTPVSDFKKVHLRINQAAYFTDGFRFRFKNYGGLSGLLDIVNLDYVHLRAGSGYQDTLFKDFAFVYPIGSLIETYTQVPWEHWVHSPTHMNPQVKVAVRNGSNISENNMNGSVKVDYASVNEGSFTLIAGILSDDINYAPRTTIESVHDFTGSYVFSTTPTANTKTFDIVGQAGAQFPNLPMNDSSYTQQVFENVYAYDDGSAEQAYGVNQAQGRVALKFVPYKADTLMGVRMYFAPSVNDVSNKLFLLTVWGDNNGIPGAVLYEDNFFNPRTPIYEDERGKFTDYMLPSRLSLGSGAFYVGTRQVDALPLNIGFDRNNPQSGKLFFSLNGGLTWTPSSLQGVPMMRPIFQTPDNHTLAIDEARQVFNWGVYPNPTTGKVTVSWDESMDFPGAVLMDSQGRQVIQLQPNEYTFDITDFPNGMYFLQLKQSNQILKIIR